MTTGRRLPPISVPSPSLHGALGQTEGLLRRRQLLRGLLRFLSVGHSGRASRAGPLPQVQLGNCGLDRRGAGWAPLRMGVGGPPASRRKAGAAPASVTCRWKSHRVTFAILCWFQASHRAAQVQGEGTQTPPLSRGVQGIPERSMRRRTRHWASRGGHSLQGCRA